MRRLNGGPPVQGTNPAASTRPLVGYKSPASILSVVVLPAPFGPRNATISPGSIRNVTLRTACTSRYRGRRSARRAPRSPGSRTFTWNVLLNRSASTIDGMGVREIYPGTPGVWPQQPLLAGPAWPGYIPGVVTIPRLLADRRHGVDRRAVPRRLAVAGAPRERRAVVDRRRGAERRSTLERRGRPPRDPSLEGPGEHLRNALQLLSQLPFGGERLVRGPQGLVVNVYTERAWRRRGVADALMRELLRWCSGNGVESIVLHASGEGRPLYQKLGFTPTNEMRYDGSL